MNSDCVTALGLIGAWAEQEEKFFLDKIITSEEGKITLTVSDAETFVEALNRIQEGLIAVLNEAA